MSTSWSQTPEWFQYINTRTKTSHCICFNSDAKAFTCSQLVTNISWIPGSRFNFNTTPCCLCLEVFFFLSQLSSEQCLQLWQCLSFKLIHILVMLQPCLYLFLQDATLGHSFNLCINDCTFFPLCTEALIASHWLHRTLQHLFMTSRSHPSRPAG